MDQPPRPRPITSILTKLKTRIPLTETVVSPDSLAQQPESLIPGLLAFQHDTRNRETAPLDPLGATSRELGLANDEYPRASIEAVTPRGPLRTRRNVFEHAGAELVGPVQYALAALGSALQLSEHAAALEATRSIVPAAEANIEADYLFFVSRVDGQGGAQSDDRWPYLVLQCLMPTALDRGRWLRWDRPRAREMRIAQEARSLAVRFNCPQVCLFDGVTLVSVFFHDDGQGLLVARPTIDIVYDHVYDSHTPSITGASLAKQRREIPERPATMREVAFDALLTGVRRVACTHFATDYGMVIEGLLPAYQYTPIWAPAMDIVRFQPTEWMFARIPDAVPVMASVEIELTGMLRPDQTPLVMFVLRAVGQIAFKFMVSRVF